MNRRSKIAKLEKLRNTECRRCNLYKYSKHVCILGKGNVMAPIMLIGEAPGSAEAKTGKVFMGRAGKLLDKLLNLLDMIEMVYIINAIRCRPPDNRDPTPKELRACHYFLDREIDIVKPKIIILLGRTAIKTMGFGASVNAGSPYFHYSPWPDAYIKATWHPAYCLRRGKAATKDLFKVLKWAKEMVGK